MPVPALLFSCETRHKGRKPRGGAWDGYAVPSTAKLCRSAAGRGKSHTPGRSPVSGGIWRRAAPLCDGQGQKPRGGAVSGQPCRLPTSCGGLRWAGVKAACRGVLWPAVPSADQLRRPTTGRSKNGLPGRSPACCGIYRRAAPLYDGQAQKRRGEVVSGLLQHLATCCAVLRWAGAKATGRGDLRPDVPSTVKLRRHAMGRSKSHGVG